MDCVEVADEKMRFPGHFLSSHTKGGKGKLKENLGFPNIRQTLLIVRHPRRARFQKPIGNDSGHLVREFLLLRLSASGNQRIYLMVKTPRSGPAAEITPCPGAD